jgi:UMF1 family MFS transporter
LAHSPGTSTRDASHDARGHDPESEGSPGRAPDPGPGRRRVGLAAWCLYDWSSSAFNTVIGTFIFSVYFARGIYGDETGGAALWTYTLGAAGLIVAVLSPILGSIADRGGRRKPWLFAFMMNTVIATALLYFARPDEAYIVYALALVVIAAITFELATVFYNSMLPTIAPDNMTGRISGWGWAMGYMGGLGSLALCLVLLIQTDTPFFGLVGTDDAQNVRATVLVVALWYFVFALPLFFLTPDTPAAPGPLREHVRTGLKVLWNTLKQIRHQGHLVRFLIASALYRDGLSTLFAVGGLYAAGTFGMTFDQILIFAIALNVTAGIGAASFAFVDDWLGPKVTILIALAALIGLGSTILLVDDMTVFIVLALGLGNFVGPAQAAGRSMMARLTPRSMESEMFGLYALAGKSISFLGPVLYATATTIFDSQRAGMATIVLVWTAGALLLATVPAPKGSRPEAPKAVVTGVGNGG